MAAGELRLRGREALRKKWVTAVLVSLVAAILGGSLSIGILSEADWGFDMKGVDMSAVSDTFGIDIPEGDLTNEQAKALFTQIYNKLDSIINNMDPAAAAFLSSLLKAAKVLWAVYCIYWLITLFIGAAVQIGEARFYIMLQTREGPTFGVLFSRIRLWLRGAWLNILSGIFCLLWSLLLVFPGIIAAYRYSMARYLLAENPDMSALNAIRASKAMMRGNKWRLFCLELSFIGWALLSIITLGIGFLFLRPYIRSSIAAFYLEARGYYDYEDDGGEDDERDGRDGRDERNERDKNDGRSYTEFQPGDA